MSEILLDLAHRWREEAATFRKYRDEVHARMAELHAEELERALAEARAEQLTLREAADESGYSVEHLRHQVAAGAIPNAGRRGAPRIARGDLPKKPRKKAVGTYDPDADALALLNRN